MTIDVLTKNVVPSNLDFLDVGNKCNFECSGCFYGACSGIDMLEDEKSEEIKAIEKISGQFKNSKIFIYPPEISTSQYLLDVISKFNQKFILSNGYKLDNSLVKNLKSAGIESISVTFFANANEQKFWQKVNKATYEKIKTNIARAVKEGLDVYVNNVVWKDNIKSIPGLVEICKNMGVKGIQFIRAMEPEWKDYFITDKNTDLLVKTVEENKFKDGPRLRLSFGFGPNLYGKTVEEARKKLSPGSDVWVASKYACPAINGDYLGVSLKKKEVYWCFWLKDSKIGKIGEIDETGEIKISNNIDMSEETLRDKLKGNCSAENCEYQSACLGGCRKTAYLASSWTGRPDLYAGMDVCLTKVYKRLNIK